MPGVDFFYVKSSTIVCVNILIVIFLEKSIIWIVQGILEYHETIENEFESNSSKAIADFMEIFYFV